MNAAFLVLLAHLAITWFLVGLIWVIQLVHYPLFGAVGEQGFTAYQHDHARRIGWIVAPAMLLEVATGAWLLLDASLALPRLPLLAATALIFVVWVSTAFVQVPCHGRLARGFDAATHRRLVASNWIRTAAWTLRGLLVAGLVVFGAGG